MMNAEGYDMVAKFVGLFSSQRLQSDWQAAEPDEQKAETRKMAGVYTKAKRLLQTHRKSSSGHYLNKKVSHSMDSVTE